MSTSPNFTPPHLRAARTDPLPRTRLGAPTLHPHQTLRQTNRGKGVRSLPSILCTPFHSLATSSPISPQGTTAYPATRKQDHPPPADPAPTFTPAHRQTKASQTKPGPAIGPDPRRRNPTNQPIAETNEPNHPHLDDEPQARCWAIGRRPNLQFIRPPA